MPFSKKPPKKVTDSGHLIAQFRFASKGMALHLGDNAEESFIFLAVTDSGFIDIFCGSRAGPGHSLKSWHSTRCGNYVRAVAEVASILEHYRNTYCHHVVEGHILRDGFAERFMEKYPELSTVVRTGLSQVEKNAPQAKRRKRASFQKWLLSQPNAIRRGRFGPIMLA